MYYSVITWYVHLFTNNCKQCLEKLLAMQNIGREKSASHGAVFALFSIVQTRSRWQSQPFLSMVRSLKNHKMPENLEPLYNPNHVFFSETLSFFIPEIGIVSTIALSIPEPFWPRGFHRPNSIVDCLVFIQLRSNVCHVELRASGLFGSPHHSGGSPSQPAHGKRMK